MKTFSLDSETNSKLIASKDLKYELLYFPLHFGGTNARAILAYAGAEWTATYPENWADAKPLQPFEQMPVLKLIHAENKSGKDLTVAESAAIDIFLAKQFGLHGENAWEEALINGLYVNTNIAFFSGVMAGYFFESASKSDDEKIEHLEKFLKGSLSDWARIHEEHLKNNGSNGHYVGDKTTLADIRTATFLDATAKVISKERLAQVVNENATPSILKVADKIENNPGYKAWVQSAEYKKLDTNSIGFVKQYHPELHPELYSELQH
ncbi:hypothetical protein B0O80DRAFT_497084 [Mortierella sp. GBAus27b]|nr:hypothetical protein BGX31_011082 [Mortierella sp. GBA43]KAI8356379.1 hypothetical protein B0O80DRAFT_497084 [Mortierella sp. GBAus27b]